MPDRGSMHSMVLYLSEEAETVPGFVVVSFTGLSVHDPTSVAQSTDAVNKIKKFFINTPFSCIVRVNITGRIHQYAGDGQNFEPVKPVAAMYICIISSYQFSTVPFIDPFSQKSILP